MTGSLSVITNERGGVIDDTLVRYPEKYADVSHGWPCVVLILQHSLEVTKCNSKEHGEHVYQAAFDSATLFIASQFHFEEEPVFSLMLPLFLLLVLLLVDVTVVGGGSHRCVLGFVHLRREGLCYS